MAEKLFNDASITNNAAPVANDVIPIIDPGTGKISYLLYSQITGLVPTIPTLDSGKYTPTDSDPFNIDSLLMNQANYLRVGDVVTVSGNFQLDATATGQVSFTFTLPISAPNLNTGDLRGTVTNNLDNGYGFLIEEASAKGARVNLNTDSIGSNLYAYVFNYIIE